MTVCFSCCHFDRGYYIFLLGIFSEKGLRWTGIGLLLIFSLVASITGQIIGKAKVLGVPIKLENLHKDKVFSVVEMLGKSEKSQDYKDLALIKEASCDDKKQKWRADSGSNAFWFTGAGQVVFSERN